MAEFTRKQLLFISFYVDTVDVFDAARLSNVSPEDAQAWLSDPAVNTEIDRHIAAKIAGKDVDMSTWVEDYLQKVVVHAFADKSYQNVLGALRLIMQHKNHDMFASNKLQVEDITGEDFMRRLGAARHRASKKAIEDKLTPSFL